MKGRRGFTLVELLTALAVGGVVLLLARTVVGQVASDARRLAEVRGRIETRALARRWLTVAFRSLQVGQGDRDGFAGSPNSIDFTSRLETAQGWSEPVAVKLGIGNGTVSLTIDQRGSIPLFQSVQALEAEYLLASGARSEWLRGWYSPSTAPIAVRVILWWDGHADGRLSDTLLIAVGSRG